MCWATLNLNPEIGKLKSMPGTGLCNLYDKLLAKLDLAMGLGLDQTDRSSHAVAVRIQKEGDPPRLSRTGKVGQRQHGGSYVCMPKRQ